MRGRSPSPYDRRRSPPGRRDRRFPNPRDRRRPRSFSPGPDRGRRSPAYKRFRREDEYYDRYDRGGSPGYRRGYDRERYDERDFRDSYRDPHGRGPHRRDQEPQSYKEFIFHLPDEVTPDDASRKYQEYLADWYGSRTKAEFEQRKDEEWMREKYDPREIVKAIERRKERAKEAAGKLLERVNGGDLKPSAPDFNQGAGSLASTEKKEGEEEDQSAPNEENRGPDGSADRPQFFAPSVCWTAERMESDLKLSMELVKKLDAEKEITGNTLLAQGDPKEEEGAVADATADIDQSEKPTSTEPSEKPDGADSEAANGEETEPAAETEEAMQAEGEVKPDVADAASEAYSTEEKLDLLLTYLWEVHMIDYYAGLELTEAEFSSTKCRMLRPARPAANEVADNETDKRMLEELRERVDKFWNGRLSNDGPWEAKSQTKKVEQAVDDFVESQVTRIGEKKWGNKLSSKLFVGREFVLKHIRLKHALVVEAEHEKILDDIYFENYKKDKEEEEHRMLEERRKSEAMTEGAEHGFDGFNDMFGGHGPRGMAMSGRHGMGGRGMMGPMVPSPMMGGPMGQVLLPAPGAGPLGPFILQPVPSGTMSPMEMGQMGMEGPRAVGGGMIGRGGAIAGRGRPWAGGGGGYRDYYDLDAPQNNRAVLDYGDL
ncbi:hypothetical protein BSKO_00121 [Bryopsis sp. KO-2023]|nr:hypothetical protein BSKO_00121 [Bryopsis sp. KO-2023]